jgi:cytochrome c peroxidase
MFTTIKLFQPETNHSPFLGFGWLSFFRLLIAGILLAFITMGCSKENETTPAEKPYSLALPAHFPEPVLNLASAKLSENKFILGKKLFYDGILSLDGRINCGTCHISFGAFSNPDHPTSHGIRDQFGKRNALPLQNLIWKKEYMWDGGISDLGLVAMAAIQNPVEMDEKMENVVFKVNAKPEYKSLFNKAYGSPDVTGLKLLDALSCFMVELVSGKSRYDLYVTNQPGANFTSDEVQGLELFREKCSRCHKEPFFTDNSFRNNGLDTVNRMDMGRYEITLRSVDRYKFRVPSLRNVTQTQPYMHNGEMRTLERVLQHYAQNAKRNSSTDPGLVKKDGTVGIDLTADEQKKIIAFLGTLRDSDFIRNERFAEE